MRRASYRSQYLILGALFLIVFLVQSRLSSGLFGELFRPGHAVGRALEVASGENRVLWTSENARAAGLQLGDRILSVAGAAFTGEGQVAAAFHAAGPDNPVQLDFERDGQRGAAIVLAPAATPLPWTRILVSFIYRFVTPVFCLVLGFFVAFQRPFDRLAWILLLLMISYSQASAGSGMLFYALSWEDWMRPVAIVLHVAGLFLWPVAMLWFAVYFPVRSRLDLRFPWAKWLLVAPVCAWGLLRMVLEVLAVEHWSASAPLAPLVQSSARYVFLLFSIPISCFFWQLGEKGGTLPSPDARRRLRLIWIGTTISLTPTFLANLIGFVGGRNFDSLPEWFVIPALLMQLLFPLTLAYVIVVQRAMDVRMAVRQGLQYALARGGLMALRVAIVVIAVLFGIRAAMVNELDGLKLALVIALAVLVVIALGRGVNRLSGWVDRRFFREAYNSEQILADLSDHVRTIVETRPLLETVALRIADSMHVPKVALLLEEAGGYRPAHTRGYATAPDVAFEFDSATAQRLRAEHRPMPVYLRDPESWTSDLPAGESAQLEQLGTELVLPLNVKDKLHGFIALSGKRSEEPYSRNDLRLLQSVATQTGLALENSRLTAAIATEVAQRERLNRELEIAREVQQRLFPQHYPRVHGLDYAGMCRPAQGVGGDYYDFVEVPDGHFGIAIGDVSGKGIPAALLMASLQAALRGQAITSPADLAGLMTNLNRLLFDASPSNRYATFFYGQYDARTRELVYVNGGHNAPMLFRGDEVIRLDEGGPVVGLFAAAKYQQASVTLRAGDVLVAFTDGISEAMNSADEEFGEEQLIPVVRAANGCAAQVLMERLFTAADAFAAGAPQHDDMTALVIRILEA